MFGNTIKLRWNGKLLTTCFSYIFIDIDKKNEWSFFSQFLIKVKKYIASTSRYLVFEQNTSQTRGKFLNTVNPYLEGIQQRQGLYAFRVVMDESNNTPDVVDRNQLLGQIFIQPTRTAEFIVLDFVVQPTGATFPE